MNKKLIILIIIFIFFFSLDCVVSGNNTQVVDNPTSIYVNSNQTVIALEDGDSNISFSDDYIGYCIEWGEHSAVKNDEYYVVNSSNAVNKRTGEDVSNYLKIIFLFFYNRTQEYPIHTQHMIWKFTDDKEFSRFDKNWYDEIVDLSNKYKINDYGTIPLNDTHELVYNFNVLMSQFSEYQNYFAYKYYIRKIITDNGTVINNETINNSTNNLIQNTNNNTTKQNNGKEYDKDRKETNSYTLNDKYICGNPIMVLLTSIISSIIIRRKI